MPLPFSLHRHAVLLLAAACCVTGLSEAAEPLVPEKPIQIQGTKGKFDFLEIDAPRRRLLAAHTGNGSLDVFDLDKKELIKSISLGAAQDCAVDAQGNHYVVSVSKPPQVALVDSEKLEVISSVPLEGPADLLVWHAASKRAYVGHDDAKQLWVVAPAEGKVTATIDLPSDSPEGLAFDGERLFQAMKTASTMTVIDVASGKVIATWPTEPAKSPHGISLISQAKAIAIAGGNGQLVLMNEADGKILASAAIPQRVDQIAYDAELHRVYCASGLGKLATVNLENGKLTPLGEVTSAEGAHSVAVDPQTHTVWIAYAKGDTSFLQAFSTAK